MSNRLRTKSPSALNRPSLWWKNLRPWFNVEAFQAKIDQRVGLNKDGKSIIRLIWGAEIWDTTFGESTPRYWTKRRKVAADEGNQGQFLWYRVPRWILEKRVEPESYMPAWQASRWAMSDVQGVPLDKGDPPAEYYLFAYLIAEHEDTDGSGWPACCNRAFYTDRSRCWGKYRQPSDGDLQLISQAVRQMEADKYRDPYAPLSPAQLLEAEMMANKQVERQAEQDLMQSRAAAADFYGLRESAIPENYGRRESGLIVPN